MVNHPSDGWKGRRQKVLLAPVRCLLPRPHLTSVSPVPPTQGPSTWTSARRARMTATSMPSARTRPSPTNASASQATRGKAGSVKVSPAQPSWPDPVAAVAAGGGHCLPRVVPAGAESPFPRSPHATAQASLGPWTEAAGFLGAWDSSLGMKFGVMGCPTPYV